ncbi:DUF1330 domain-containing protein [Rhodoblastus acidophilus]|jgi:uncharacterized protein (DUF1330 family)|uniref:DUF1330 domain-containing protein n=1 Tax=Rhodoblastus acidophilus TaxID=1074 RepID=A0A6N8DQJ1_RHOAC|nr:DUF1330 domain-containing protein [Rhodoblastus acidophilus]MCW2275609.1 uncharacterized protein (DUF1330 family) [Rhodoblastus acidophilus]MTV32106.1 DUF1330 domain-containing protein [Rhodoblastus acidophilus]
MTVYLIAQVKVTDDAWIPTYAEKVHDIAAKHGGKYLSRSGRITPIEGPQPDLSLVALIQFPSLDDLKGFVNDPDYASFAKARQDGTHSTFFAIDDTDAAGTIPYLGKGG